MKYLALLFVFAQANALSVMPNPDGSFPRFPHLESPWSPAPFGLPGPGSINPKDLDSKNSPQIFMNIFQSGLTDSNNPSIQPDQMSRLQSELNRMHQRQMENSLRMNHLSMENEMLKQQLRDQQQKPVTKTEIHEPPRQPQMHGPPQMPAVLTHEQIKQHQQTQHNPRIPSSGPVGPAVITPHQMPIPSSGPKGPMPPTPPGMVSAQVMPHQIPSSGPKGPMPPTPPGMVSAQVMPHHPSSGPKGPMPPQPMMSAFSAPGAQARPNQFPGGFAPQH